MGRSYAYTWEGHYKEDGDGDTRHHLVYGMTISEIIKTMIHLYEGKVKQFEIKIYHQTRPLDYPVRLLKINQNFDWPKSLVYISETYKAMGLDYYKPIPRRYYELKEIESPWLSNYRFK